MIEVPIPVVADHPRLELDPFVVNDYWNAYHRAAVEVEALRLAASVPDRELRETHRGQAMRRLTDRATHNVSMRQIRETDWAHVFYQRKTNRRALSSSFTHRPPLPEVEMGCPLWHRQFMWGHDGSLLTRPEYDHIAEREGFVFARSAES